LFGELKNIARGQPAPTKADDEDVPGYGYTLRGKAVTENMIRSAAELAASACVTLLVEYPAQRLEDREARLKVMVEEGSWRVPKPWRRKAYARAQSDVRALMGG
jgi:hypothetical protein